MFVQHGFCLCSFGSLCRLFHFPSEGCVSSLNSKRFLGSATWMANISSTPRTPPIDVSSMHCIMFHLPLCENLFFEFS